ncbi:MAG: hypothetical protein JXA67_22260 [Micromonosporaceae bacterium]|nr:hypothetical protein [Micromonosporaceae bacterium]
MTTSYGDYLDETAAALSRVYAALRKAPPDGITDYAAAAIARTQFYRALEQQIVTIAGGAGGDLAQSVRRATARTSPHLPSTPEATGPVALALRAAADASRAAGDILATHFDPRGRPRTSDAMAIAAGVDREPNLARLAQLARAANDIDRRLAQWLRHGYEQGSQQPIVESAIADAEHTAANRRRPPKATAQADRATLHRLGPAPLVNAADRWATITTPAEAVAAVDVARAWLVRHRDHLTAADLKLLTRVGLALSYEVEYLAGITTGANTIGANTIGAEAITNRWLRAARAADGLRSLHRPDAGDGPTALAAAETWIRDQLRPNRRWLPAEELHASPELAAWRQTARDLAARMPDLATLVHHGAQHAVQQGELFELHMRLQQRGRLVAEPQWRVAQANVGPAAELLTATRELRGHSVRLAEAAGTSPLPGLHEAETRYQQARRRVQDEVRRVAASEPLDAAGITHGRSTSVRRDAAPVQRPPTPSRVEPPRPETPRTIEPPQPRVPPPSRGL